MQAPFLGLLADALAFCGDAVDLQVFLADHTLQAPNRFGSKTTPCRVGLGLRADRCDESRVLGFGSGEAGFGLSLLGVGLQVD